MSWLNLPNVSLARCGACHGHVRIDWHEKAEHDGVHAATRAAAAMTVDVLQAARERRIAHIRQTPRPPQEGAEDVVQG